MKPKSRANLIPVPVHIGKNVRIGANAVYGGVPAVEIKRVEDVS
jgi:tetrahydrodipicolinate N-succinyltransferase